MIRHNMLVSTFAIASLFVSGFLATPAWSQVSSRYQKMRLWTASGGASTYEAKLISANQESVTLENESGKQATIPIAQLSDEDQVFISKYHKSLFDRLKLNVRKTVLATDALKQCQEFLANEYLVDENLIWVQEKIKSLETPASNNAVILPKRFVTPEELADLKGTARRTVLRWTKMMSDNGDGTDQKMLREATRDDPTSFEAALFGALYYEIHDALFEQSQRLLEDAAERADLYSPVATDNDRKNHMAVLNNLAVSYARSGQVSRSIKSWQELEQLSDGAMPANSLFNIEKIHRMLNDERSGYTVSRNEKIEFDRLRKSVGSIGNDGGWRLMSPTDEQGKTHNAIQFLLVDNGAQSVKDGFIEDTRCVRCVGTTLLKCPAEGCKNGAIEIPIEGPIKKTFPDGTVQTVGWGRIGTDVQKCNGCRGEGAVRCPFCENGRQRN